MAYKVFLAPTGSGNTVYEGDVLNGYCSPDGKRVKVQFFSNDRGYTAAAYNTDQAGAKALCEELKGLLESHSQNAGKFEADSAQRNFKLVREFESSPLILFCNGSDSMQGRCFHRGMPEAMKKLLSEFETVLKTVEDVVAGRGPKAE